MQHLKDARIDEELSALQREWQVKRHDKALDIHEVFSKSNVSRKHSANLQLSLVSMVHGLANYAWISPPSNSEQPGLKVLCYGRTLLQTSEQSRNATDWCAETA